MKSFLLIASLTLAGAGFMQAAEPANPAEQQLLAALKEVQTQQAQIADNQAKIEAKLAAIAEAVRVARIYASRSGH